MEAKPQNLEEILVNFLFFRHALDIREHYERKLERANNLYMELSAIMLQLEVREKELMKYVKESCLLKETNSMLAALLSVLFLSPWAITAIS